MDAKFYAVIQTMYDAEDTDIHAPTEERYNVGTQYEVVITKQTVGATAIIETVRPADHIMMTSIDDLTWGKASLEVTNTTIPYGQAVYREKSRDTNGEDVQYGVDGRGKWTIDGGNAEPEW